MKSLFFVVTAILIAVGLIKWRLSVSEKSLEGRKLPAEAGFHHPTTTLYYFYHPRCGPCRYMTPMVDDLIEKNPGRIEKINVSDHRAMIREMGIRATPTTVLVKDSTIIKALIGGQSARALEDMLKSSNS